MKSGKKFLSMIMAVCCVASLHSFTTEAAGSWPEGTEIQSEAGIVMDADSGMVLCEKNAHEQLYPASITKVLTGLVAIENSQMDEQVTFSEDSVYKTEGSGIYRDVGEIMNMEECLYALLLNSANECAYAIAEHVGGGDYQTFIDMMNERAAGIGCQNTHFNNPHGLPDENHYTTCYDMALIAREAWKNETFRQISGSLRYNIPPTNKHEEITYLLNQHKMLREDEEQYYEYCVGGKTGFTDDALNTLVTYAEKDGMTLICVTLKGNKTHYADTRALLDYCFENFHCVNIAENLGDGTQVEGLKAEYFTSEAFAEIDREAKLILPNGVEYGDTSMEVIYNEEVGDTAAIFQYSYDGRVVGSVSVAASRPEIETYPFQSIVNSTDAEEIEQADENVKADERVKTDETDKNIKTDDVKKEDEKESGGFKPWYIILIVLGCAIVAFLIFVIYKVKENSHEMRYRYYSRRNRDPWNQIIQRKRRRRRR